MGLLQALATLENSCKARTRRDRKNVSIVDELDSKAHTTVSEPDKNRLDVTSQTDKSPSHLTLSVALSHFLPFCLSALCCWESFFRQEEKKHSL